MKRSVWYACDEDAMYEKERVIPDRTWIVKAQRVALPNTYHHRAVRGTGCFMIGPSAAVIPRRSSSVSHVVFRNRRIMVVSSLFVGPEASSRMGSDRRE